MIRSLDIKDPAKTPVEWLPKVKSLAQPMTFEFTPGLNILWGPNGSGKSTLITLMARVFHCEQSGMPVMTQSSVDTLAGGFNDKFVRLKGFVLKHDGQPVRCVDPSKTPGIIGGQFDDDFFALGVSSMMAKGSAGQTTYMRAGQIIDQMAKDTPPEMEFKILKSQVNSVWVEKIEKAEALLKGSGKKGPLTILMDEPDRSLDLPSQVAMWRFVRAYSKRYQIIVAAHSLFALHLPEANYIELAPGYLHESHKALSLLCAAGWPAETPTPRSK